MVNAARVSYAKWKEEWDNRDKTLLEYLSVNNHWSPFTHAVVQFRVSASIAVARQLWKTHVGIVADEPKGWNEMSRRYVSEAPTFDLPEVWRSAPGKGQSKQGSGEGLAFTRQRRINAKVEALMEMVEETYNYILQQYAAPEQARLVLPMATVTEWIWTGSLYAFIRICKERLASDAQEETRVVAKAIRDRLHERFPYSVKAWEL